MKNLLHLVLRIDIEKVQSIGREVVFLSYQLLLDTYKGILKRMAKRGTKIAVPRHTKLDSPDNPITFATCHSRKMQPSARRQDSFSSKQLVDLLGATVESGPIELANACFLFPLSPPAYLSHHPNTS
jgi:hypothetical protein